MPSFSLFALPLHPIRSLVLSPSSFQRFDLSAQINRLKSATAAAEKESDALAASFQRGDVPEDEFVKQYKELRRAYHKRALQMDKAQQNRIG